MRGATAWIRFRVLRPTPATLAAAVALLAAADWGSRLAGDSVVPGGPLDETAHVLTMLLVLWAVGPAVTRRFAVPALIASVAIDADHVPQHLGTRFLTEGTPRPYTHSLLTLVVVLVLATTARGPTARRALLGALVGLAVHFWRDLSESGSGVALLWPFADAAFTLPHWSYVAVMAAVAAVDARRFARSPQDIRLGRSAERAWDWDSPR
jgi:hypothetical protein